ncbi:MAG: efflux RND transporter periplasmic adaptor subunit [Sulfuricella sp.]|nr:efflux RND transporter periplasmic adaptor subunit [Sulfuricella sp.]
MMKWILAGMLWAATAAWAESFPATLQWSQRVELSPRVSGIVREVGVNAGDRVKKGQSLLILDAAPYQARVAESRAVVARFAEETAEAQRDLGRTQELYDRTVISTSELDQAKLRQARAKAQLDGAQARLARERQDLTDSALRAPFDAVVVARLAEPGQHVAVGLQPQPLLVLAKAGEMAARFKVSADRIGSLKAGQAVTVVVGKQDYPATLKNLGLEPVKDKDGVAYEADAVFAVKELLRAGMAATVKLPD